jgi:polyhydroxyalkanoate synthase
MKKKNTKSSNAAPKNNINQFDFKGLNDLFENNLKLYNSFVQGAAIKNQEPKKNSTQQNFEPQDLYKLISPTTDRIFESLNAFSGKVHKDPRLLFENIHIWMEDIVKLNYYFISKASNQKVDPIIKPNIADQRFSSKDWSENLIFDFIKQFYLITTTLLENLVEKGIFDDPKQKDYFKFYIKQIITALSPTNFVFTNPDILTKTIKEGGQNLIRGYENYRKDNEKNPNKFFISQTQFDKFEVGKNLATTEGKVIYKNNIFELIHYNSDTEKQFEIPLLVIPPFINKYYIMDINKEKSLVKFLVENKINAFLISWKNPNSDSRDHGFKDYIEDGVMEAIKVACKQSGSPKVNLASYCIGGTLLSMTLAHLSNIKEKEKSLFTSSKHLKNVKIKDYINSATFFASLVDFEDFGDLQMFISEKQISSIEHEMKKVGYFDGKNLAATFNFLRPGELYWNYVVNNYLLGNEPSAFDVLYWNNDSTNLPEKLYSDYLRSLCLNNNLAKNNYELAGKKLDLSKITTPMFHVATTADHICPWKSVFKGLEYYNSNIKFILSNSGHVAGIMKGKKSKPGKSFFYSADDDNIKMTPDKWLKSAKKYEGSWWPTWSKWLVKRSGNLKDAKELNLNKYPAIYDAPGQYVIEK